MFSNTIDTVIVNRFAENSEGHHYIIPGSCGQLITREVLETVGVRVYDVWFADVAHVRFKPFK